MTTLQWRKRRLSYLYRQCKTCHQNVPGDVCPRWRSGTFRRNASFATISSRLAWTTSTPPKTPSVTPGPWARRSSLLQWLRLCHLWDDHLGMWTAPRRMNSHLVVWTTANVCEPPLSYVNRLYGTWTIIKIRKALVQRVNRHWSMLPKGGKGSLMSPPWSEISGLSFDSTLLSPLFFFCPVLLLSCLFFCLFSACWSILLNVL